MAYTKGTFNPDALPAHVEPQQAAQIISQYSSTYSQNSSATPPAQQEQQQQQQQQQQQHSWANKPPPPLPNQAQAAQQSHSVSPRPEHAGPRRPSAPATGNSYSSYQGPSPGPGGHSPTPPYHGRNHSNTAPPGLGQRPPLHGPLGSGASAGPGGLVSSTGGIPPIGQAGSDGSLFPLFRAVDVHGTGQLTEDELSKALRNGDYTSFDPETVRLMIRMFDHDHSGTIGFEEFCGLFSFLGAWRHLFDRFDADQSGYISLDEYTNALLAFGYHLTPAFVSHMYGLYDRRRTGAMTFDLFVQSCISLKRMTDVFKQYDTDRDGFITLSFEEFLREILNQR